MRFRYDHTTDVLDIELIEGAHSVRTEQLDSGTLVDLDEDDRPVAIEIIRPGRAWPLDAILDRFSLDASDAEVLHSLWGQKGQPLPSQRTGSASRESEVVLA